MSERSLNYLIASNLLVSMPTLADTANESVYGVANVSCDVIDTGTTAVPGIALSASGSKPAAWQALRTGIVHVIRFSAVPFSKS